MSAPKAGDPAPDFTLEGPDGTFTLAEQRGRRVILLFYPGDDTTVCTKQFCSYRDHGDTMGDLDAVVVGISGKDVASKAAFRDKHGLTVPLLADEDLRVAEAYGVAMKRLGMPKRSTFVIDEAGIVRWRKVNPLSLTYTDADELREVLAGLPAPAAG